MKKFSILIALVLLAVAGTGYAVTCAYDNVPAATLLVPYWKVSLNGATGYPIPTGGTDTLVSVVNVSAPGVIAHVTVWNKYSKAVMDFNIPLTGKDVVSFSMRDIMNGKLSPNLPQCDPDPRVNTPAQLAFCRAHYPVDPCGITNAGAANVGYAPSIGWGQTQFIRFSHPDAMYIGTGGAAANDVVTSISQYNLTNVDAFGGSAFRDLVWHSLDESGDITSFTSPGAINSGNILDGDNPACITWTTSVALKNALSGYLTIDVVNYCTNYFPDQLDFYTKDAIATAGWGSSVGARECSITYPCYSPNVLFGDVFYVDSNAVGGNISGDPAVPLEFDSRLSYPAKTFFGKFVVGGAGTFCAAETTNATGCTAFINNYAAAFQFPGDGREPLGDRYGFRYLADQVNGLQSWLLVWRSDFYQGTDINLCKWARPAPGNAGAPGSGLYDTAHMVQVVTYDNDENQYAGSGITPGPSGLPPSLLSPNYIFLESQRIDLLAATTPATGWNPAVFKGGWVDLTLRGPGLTGATAATGLYNMGWVGVQHSAPGQFISVGYAAANLNNQFQCSPNTPATGTNVTGTGGVWPVFP
jgi:hypothetical protein